MYSDRSCFKAWPPSSQLPFQRRTLYTLPWLGVCMLIYKHTTPSAVRPHDTASLEISNHGSNAPLNGHSLALLPRSNEATRLTTADYDFDRPIAVMNHLRCRPSCSEDAVQHHTDCDYLPLYSHATDAQVTHVQLQCMTL